MDKIGPSPFCWLELDADGRPLDPGAVGAIEAVLGAPGVGDLVVVSHGWQTTKADAKTLYGTLWGNVVPALTHKDPTKIAVCGIVWPSVAYSTDLDDAAATASAAGRPLSAAAGVEERDLSDSEFDAVLARLSDLLGERGKPVIEAARAAGQGIDFATADALFSSASAAVQPHGGDPELQVNAQLFAPQGSPDAILAALAEPPSIAAAPGLGGTRDLGDAIGGLLNGPRAAVARVLNQLSYYEMKTRAGVVGAALGRTILPRVTTTAGKRLHLIGHSFGARLVTAAASALPNALPFEFFSLTLLQGAFSHNALASAASGPFVNVVGRPKGPVAITHTHNDRACTFWYALASRLSQDSTKGFGDADDIFGAMGANGPQRLAASALAPDVGGAAFAPRRGKVNRFLADAYIVKTAASDAHNNVANPTCGKLVAAVLQS